MWGNFHLNDMYTSSLMLFLFSARRNTENPEVCLLAQLKAKMQARASEKIQKTKILVIYPFDNS